MSYPVPLDTVRYEIVIRKSRFIAITGPASDADAARTFIANVSAEFDDARHICYACIIGSPQSGSRASNDDGEPHGSAGKPMLNVLQHSGVGDIIAVVVRYFGGVKLGTGGLARAYGGSVAETMKILPVHTPVATCPVQIGAPFALERDIRHALGQHHAGQIQIDYHTGLSIRCHVASTDIDQLRAKLEGLGRGQIVLSMVD